MPRYIGTEPDLMTGDDEGLKKSPYYWWWRYLRCNDDYLAECERGGGGPLASLYTDFGDVREDNFRHWWDESGEGRCSLFQEDSALADAAVLDGPGDWRRFMGQYPYVVVAVDMRFGLETAKEDVRRALNDRFDKEGTGRPPIDRRYSTARRKLTADVSRKVYENGILLYEALLPLIRAGRTPSTEDYWRVGVEIVLDPRSMPKTTDAPIYLADKKKDMAEVGRRYLKKAMKMVAVTSTGYFPAPRPAAFDEIEAYISRQTRK
jgi:hypothetical protein